MDDKLMLASLLLKNPILWAATTAGGLIGAALDHDGLTISPPLKVLVALLAFFGAFFAQLFNFWLKSRAQRAKETEDHGARWERLLEKERESHEKEVARYLGRIAELENRFFDKEKE